MELVQSEERREQEFTIFLVQNHAPKIWTRPLANLSRFKISLQLTLRSDVPITAHTGPLLSMDPVHESIEIVDTATGSIVSGLSLSPFYKSFFYDSWTRTTEFGLFPYEMTSSPYLVTFEPGIPKEVALVPRSSSWHRFFEKELLMDGREYILRLRQGSTVPRWTFGREDDMKGPYNLPPILLDCEEERRVEYRVVSYHEPYMYDESSA